MPISLEKREEIAERRARVVEMRRSAMQFAEIAEVLGVTKQRAHQIYLKALEEIPAQQVELHRAEAVELATIAIDDLLAIARDHKQPRTSVEAWSAIRGWAERLARVLGTDATMKVEATVTAAPETPDIVRLVEIAKAQAAAAQEQLDATS